MSIPDLDGIEDVLFDFDGTAAETFATPPNGVAVEEACRLALMAVFGVYGDGLFEKVGGLQNRSPREFINAVFDKGWELPLALLAKDYLTREAEHLRECVPAAKGVPLVWRRGNEFGTIVELFVRAKLRILLEQVGPEWPNPSPGFFHLLELLRDKGVGTGIITAGHEVFVRKFFDAHDVEVPELLTDDDIRGTPDEGTQKPDAKLFEIFNRRFQVEKRWKPGSTLFIGDDRERDGGLAQRANMPFGWYSTYTVPPESKLRHRMFQFGHYSDLIHAFRATERQAAE